MGVLAIWRYPVKAMLGELLDAVTVGGGGLVGDRRWVVVDVETGERIANKRGPTHPALRACQAELGEDGALRVTLPGGELLEGGEIAVALGELLGRRVRLERANGVGSGRLFDTGSHHDCAPVHFVTTRTLAQLRALAPGSDFDPRRLRPNLVLDDGGRPGEFSEDALLGRTLNAAGGGPRLAVRLPTPRCVVPTRAHAELPADPGILRATVRHHRFDLGPFGRQGCAGAYAEVAAAGRLAVGDRLEPSGTAPSDTRAFAREAAARLA